MALAASQPAGRTRTAVAASRSTSIVITGFQISTNPLHGSTLRPMAPAYPILIVGPSLTWNGPSQNVSGGKDEAALHRRPRCFLCVHRECTPVDRNHVELLDGDTPHCWR